MTSRGRVEINLLVRLVGYNAYSNANARPGDKQSAVPTGAFLVLRTK
jgi:hypothetical protein